MKYEILILMIMLLTLSIVVILLLIKTIIDYKDYVKKKNTIKKIIEENKEKEKEIIIKATDEIYQFIHKYKVY